MKKRKSTTTKRVVKVKKEMAPEDDREELKEYEKPKSMRSKSSSSTSSLVSKRSEECMGSVSSKVHRIIEEVRLYHINLIVYRSTLPLTL